MTEKKESSAPLDWAALLLALALPLSIAGVNIAAGALTAALLWKAWHSGGIPWKRAAAPPALALWLYFGAALLVSYMALNPSRVYGELQRDFHKIWIVTLLALALPLVRTRRIPQALAAAFSLAAVYGIFQALTQTYGDEADPMRVRAHAFVHAVTYGQQMALAVLGTLCFWRKPEAGADGPRGLRASAAFLALCLGALLLSQTRGALLALAGGFACLCLVSRPHRRLVPVALAGAAAGAFAMERLVSKWRSFFTAVTITGIAQGDNGLNPNFHRLILWKTALRMFHDRPVFGLGPGNFHTSFINYFRGKVDGEWIWNSAHNLYLHHLAERGLVGAAALLVVIVVFTGRSWRRARREPSPWNLWAFSAWGAFWAMNLTEVSFQVEILMTLMLFIEFSADAAEGRQAREN